MAPALDMSVIRKSNSLLQLLHLVPGRLEVLHVVSETKGGIIGNQAVVIEEVALLTALLLLLRQVAEEGPVDQVQIDVIELEILQTLLRRLLHVLRLPVHDPELGRDEELLTLHQSLLETLLDALAHRLLILVQNEGFATEEIQWICKRRPCRSCGSRSSQRRRWPLSALLPLRGMFC